jgi:hypothetical protein
MRNYLILCILLGFLLLKSTRAQNQLTVLVLDEDSVSFFPYSVYLVNAASNDSSLLYSDISGVVYHDSLETGLYKLYLSFYPGVKEVEPKVFDIGDTDSLHFTFVSTYCEPEYPIKACPKSGRSWSVIRVDYSVRLHNSFKDEKAFERFSRKVRRNGYLIHTNDGVEFIRYIHDDQMDSVLTGTDYCDEYLFCKRHHLLFK